MIRPVGNASDAALRVGITNERGEYRVGLGANGAFVLTALRISFRPEAGKPVTITGAEGPRVDVVMRSIPLAIAPVSVTTRRVRCLPLDDPEQSVDVRDWVHHAQDLIHVRRAVELEYQYSIHEVRTRIDARTGERKGNGEVMYVQHPGDSARIYMEESTARAPTGESFPAGGHWWRVPEEGTLLSPTFTKRLCFDDVLIPTDRDRYDVRFRQVDAHGLESALEGTFRMTAGGVLSEILYRVRSVAVGVRGASPIRAHDIGLRVYSSVDIDGESFPLVIFERVDGGRERRFTYSAFVRRK